jgi:methyl-accepting chemotaxis protein
MKNTPIAGKVLFILAALGAFSLIIAAYASAQIWKIDTNYSALMDHQMTAAIDVKSGNRDLQNVRASIAQLMITSTDDGDRAAKLEMDDNYRAFEGSLDKAIAADPSDASDLQALKARGIQIVEQDCANAIRLGAAATTSTAMLASQQAFLTECAPKFPPLAADVAKKAEGMVADVNKADDALTETTKATIGTTVAIALGGLALVMIGAFIAIRAWIGAPLNALSAVMGRLAGGDFTAAVSATDRRDEVGAMAKAVQVFKDNGLKAKSLEIEAAESRAAAEAERGRADSDRRKTEAEQAMVVETLADSLGKLAGGDLTARIEAQFDGQYVKIKSDFNDAMDKLQEAMQAISVNTQAIRGGGEEISQAADDLSRRTEQQAASLEETAAALDQITATVRRTAEGANEANGVVGAAKTDAEHSGEVVREAVAAMSAIEKSSNQIGQIIGVIDEIAFQTNLLALNAGVEAARAGDAGRGFAVVASEVRALAQRSADAAKEIKALISASSQQVNSGVGLVGETGKALERIVRQVAQINTLVTEIAASAQEQATGLAQVNTAVNQMDQVTQQNAAMVEQSTAASHALAQEAEDLARLVAQFKTGGEAAPVIRYAPKRRTGSAPQQARPALKSVGRGGAALKASPAATEENWEEF